MKDGYRATVAGDNGLTAVVSGYYGFGNAGDEALLEALLAAWRERRPDTCFVVVSGNPEETAARYGVEAIDRRDWKALAAALREADVFVSGGGSLLQDVTSARTIPYYTGMMAWARRLDVPVVVYSQGIGPIRRGWLRRTAGRALSRAHVVSLRDGVSMREAEVLGVALHHMERTADPVFAFPFALTSSEDESVRSTPLDRLGAEALIGVSLRPLQGDRSGEGTRRWVDRLAETLVPFLDGRGARAVPLPLYPAQDDAPLRQLFAQLGPERVAPWPKEWDPRQFRLHDWLQLVGQLDMCIGMRLHALLFAAVAQTPFVALADDPKVDAHVEELGLEKEDACIAADALDRLTGVLNRAWTQRSETARRLQKAKPLLAARARRAAALAVETAEKHRAAGTGVQVLGVRFDPVTMDDAVARAAAWVEGARGDGQSSGPAHIVTANPEIVMAARKDGDFARVLAEADLVVPDGVGIVAAARLLGRPVPERVPGIELTEALLKEAAARGWRVFLLGGGPGVAEAAAANLRKKWPRLRIVGVRDGYFGKGEEDAVARFVAEAAPDVVFVGMGAPRQERFIAARRREVARTDDAASKTAGSHSAAPDAASWRSVKIAIGVGGSLDVLAGRVPRAPVLWQRLGLEWLHRLIRQPSRFRRALALPKFAALVLFRAVRRNLL